MSSFAIRQAFVTNDIIARKIVVVSYPRVVPTNYSVNSPITNDLSGIINAPGFSKVVNESYIINSLT